MCGVAAIFAYHYAALDVDREELRLIRDHMKNRGPDGFGEWFSEDGRVGLGHRRLAIIDLSEKGAQPMKNQSGDLVISFNGEIYNYKELRAELERKGYFFQSNCDTEVLLHLYTDKGEGMVHDLRGMFAFALWDAKKKAMLLVRDHFGIKPLYYADDGWTVRVASQVKALLASRKVSRMKEPAGTVGFFLMGSVPEPFTTYQEIRQVPAGSYVWVNQLGPSSPKSYFSIAEIFSKALSATDGNKPFQNTEIKSIVHEALMDSIRYHFVSDVPVGIFLSSGMDSGSLVGLARDAGIKDLRTFTLIFPEFSGQHTDEGPLASDVAKHYGTTHTAGRLNYTSVKSDLPKFLEAMDQPTIDGINTYFVSKITAENGLKVALSGLGGDEMFGGYPSFRSIPFMAKSLWVPTHIPGLGMLSRILLSSSSSSLWKYHMSPKLAGVVQYGGTYEGSYLLRRGLFMPWELKSVLGKEIVGEGLKRLGWLQKARSFLRPDPGKPFARVATLEMSLYMRNQLLRDTDWTGMLHSLEVRVPYIDVKLLRALAPILVRLDASNQKSLLAQSPNVSLPSAVLHRKKTGFIVPMDSWLASDKSLDDWKKVSELNAPNCHWSRRWSYVVYNRLAA